MREHSEATLGTASPRYMVWENVAGAFSSHKGEDFRRVLEEIARIVEPDAVIPEPPKGKWRTPRAVVESHLSQILEENPLPRYFLSAKACQGILKRAERNKKELPEYLRLALEIQSRTA